MSKQTILVFWVGSALIPCHHRNKLAATLQGVAYRIAFDTGIEFNLADVEHAMTAAGLVPGEVLFARDWSIVTRNAFRQLTAPVIGGR